MMIPTAADTPITTAVNLTVSVRVGQTTLASSVLAWLINVIGFTVDDIYKLYNKKLISVILALPIKSESLRSESKKTKPAGFNKDTITYNTDLQVDVQVTHLLDL